MFLLLFPNSLPDLCSSFKVLVRRLRRFLFSLNEPIHCILIIIERRRGRIEDFISNMLYPRLNFIRQFVTFDEPRWRKSKPWHHVLFFAVLLSFLFSSSSNGCLLYTSDAADDLLCVDLGGRRIIKKKKKKKKK